MVLRYLDDNESMNDIAKEQEVRLTILSGCHHEQKAMILKSKLHKT